MIVADASVVAKLIVAEADSGRVEDWYRSAQDEIAAPDLIMIEVAQAVVRRVNMRQVEATKGEFALRAWREILDGGGIVLIAATPSQVEAAARLAISLGHPVKDCLYLAVAMDNDARLFTADMTFAARARRVYPQISVLGES